MATYNPKIEQDRTKAVKYLDSLLKGSDKFIIKKKTYPRSLNQNSLYWLWLSCIEDETGNDANDLHELFKWEFCPSEHKILLGKSVRIESTKNLTKKQFTEYLNKIDMFCQTELHIKLPYPEDIGFDEFYDKYAK